jgi:ATP/maltotriose-dependent transcriptional regulator MalT
MQPEGSATLAQAASVLVHANLLHEGGRFAAAWLSNAQRRGWPLVAALAASLWAMVALASGAVSDAVAYANEALSPTAEAWIPPFGVAFLVEALSLRGDLEGAREALTRRGLDGDLPVAWQFTAVLFFRARLYAACGEHRRAVSELLRCGELCEAWGAHNPAFFPWRSTAALSLTALGEQDEALPLARKELDLARAWGTSCAIGIATRAVGNAERDGAATLRGAVSELERSESPLELAHALVDLGAVLRRAGERSEAREHLRRGLDLAHHHGALPLAERARDELVVAGGRPRRDALRGRDALTPSELRVARMASSGLTNRQIAQALFVTLRTVELHLTSTYGKLGIASRGQLGEALGS